MHLLFLKSWPWGPTFGSLDPLDSDQGPTLMHLINLKVLAFEGPTFDSFGPLASGQGPNRMHLLNLRSWPWGPTLEPFASLYVLDSEAPERGLVEPEP